jgi:hypothetical protein
LLVEHFGADKPLADITRGDAANWRLSLVARKLADASGRIHCGFAKHFFARAVDHELVPTNLAIHCISPQQVQRKCMGIEPTRRTNYVRRNGFEDRGRHQACRHFRAESILADGPVAATRSGDTFGLVGIAALQDVESF